MEGQIFELDFVVERHFDVEKDGGEVFGGERHRVNFLSMRLKKCK